MSSTLPTLPGKHPDYKCTFDWQNLSVWLTSNLQNKQVQRQMVLNGRVQLIDAGSLSSLGQTVVLTRLEVNGHTVIDKATTNNQPQFFTPVRLWERSNGRGVTVRLPDEVLPGDTINVMRGYLPANVLLKSRVKSVPVNKTTDWVHLGRRLTPLSIKFTKLKVTANKADIHAQFKGKSPRQFMVNFFASDGGHILPRIGAMWLQDDAGNKQPISMGAGGMTSSKGFTGQGQMTTQWGGKRKFTSLKIMIIDEVKPVKLKFELHNLHIPTFKTKHAWDKK